MKYSNLGLLNKRNRKQIPVKYFLVIIVSILLNACQTSEFVSGSLSKEGPIYETGPVLPELRKAKLDTAIVVLYPNARVFYIDLKLKNSALYTKMLRTAEKDQLPVNVRIFKRSFNPGGEEISEVYPPTAKQIEAFKASMHQ